MTQTYTVTGMTCNSCEAKVKSALLTVNHVIDVTVSKDHNLATITMDKPVNLSYFKNVLDDKYQISNTTLNETVKPAKSWLATYKPVLLIFCYILFTTAIIEYSTNNFDISRWMRHFMAGFFLVFSFFKLLNLEGFKNSYAMYDIIAKKIPNWGYIYAFTELALGLAYLLNLNPIITNSVTVIIMSISIIGVLQTVLNKKTIQCACLGDVFNLPMSTVTIIEDGLMIIMAIGMLIMAIN